MSTGPARWSNANTVLAVLGLIVSVAIFVVTEAYPYAPIAIGGAPGFYPRVLAGFLALLSIAVFVEGWIRRVRVPFPTGANLVRLLGLVGLLALTPLMFEWLGFRIMGIVVTLGAMLLLSDWRSLDARKLAVLGVTAVAATLALYFIFESVARVPLPRGRVF
jgi:hypothetical protein